MTTRPPFRADHVGSLLRPKVLQEARAKWKAGTLPHDALRSVEDQCIAAAIARQESIGLRAATDGEYRRAYWHYDFVAGLDGVEIYEPEQKIQFQGNQQVDGINTIKLVRKPVLGTHVTLWVDPTSYLPVRIMITDPQPSGPATVQIDDFRWLSPTTGHLASLHAAEQRGVIPPGFRSLPGTDVPMPGPATGPS